MLREGDMTMRHRMLAMVIAAVAGLATLLGTTSAAHAMDAGDTSRATTAAAPDAGVSITETDTSKWPYVRLAFATDSQAAQLPDIKIEENGRMVSSPRVFQGPLGSYEDRPRPVLYLVLDASMTMQGAKFEQAKAAARDLIAQSRDDDRIGLVTFGADAEVIVEPTTDREELLTSLEAVEITQGTKMHDALTLAAEGFPGNATRRMIVLLADGQDIASRNSLDEALEAAKASEAEVHAVGIEGRVFFPKTLSRIANTTGGSFESVARAEDLQAVYAQLGRKLLRAYWLEYRSTQPGGEAVKLTLFAGDLEVPSSFRAPAVRGKGGGVIKLTEPKPAVQGKPFVNLPEGRAGILLAALPFGLILGFLALNRLQARGRLSVHDRIEPYTKRVTVRSPHEDRKRSAGQAFAPLARVAESVLGRTSLFQHFRLLLEQANLPLKAAELLFMCIGGGLFGSLIGFGLIRAVFPGVLFPLCFGMLPYIWVRMKARKRKRMFEDQLADVLTTISSSLKAGHSFNQSLNAVIKETPNPTSEEFQRVMTEARLGMPLEDALETMAKRLGSNDFDFVVTTVNIQRTVGGSLAEILEMVGDTVRGRQQFRKKVKALTSMGTASAYVLLAMPVFMAGILTLMNRRYMQPLFYTDTGHKLLMAGAFFMVVGYFACMKVVKVKV
jgi:tight adherence protein B